MPHLAPRTFLPAIQKYAAKIVLLSELHHNHIGKSNNT